MLLTSSATRVSGLGQYDTEKVLRKIFDYSLRAVACSHNNMKTSTLSMARSWRSNAWWSLQGGFDYGFANCQVPGRPCTRWEDIFEKWLGLCWRESAAQRAVWITLKGDFVSFPCRLATSSAKYAKLVLQHRGCQHIKTEPRLIPDDLRSVLWFPLDGARRWLQLNGDSKVRVQLAQWDMARQKPVLRCQSF